MTKGKADQKKLKGLWFGLFFLYFFYTLNGPYYTAYTYDRQCESKIEPCGTPTTVSLISKKKENSKGDRIEFYIAEIPRQLDLLNNKFQSMNSWTLFSGFSPFYRENRTPITHPYKYNQQT